MKPAQEAAIRLIVHNWQQSDWPEFKFDLSGIEGTLFSIAEKAGRIGGVLDSFAEDMRIEAVIEMMVAEAMKTSQIEGEYLNRQDIVSSIRNKLGLGYQPVEDLRAAGVAELMVKYMAITRASKATATRDLANLVDQGVFTSIGGGRSRRYALRF